MRSHINLVVGAFFLVAISPAFAHKLNVKHLVRTGQRVWIESQFETGEFSVGASVKVQASNGSLIAEGAIDDRGQFLFRFKEADDLRVIVNDGLGHRVEIRINAKELSDGIMRDGSCRAAASLTTPFTAATVSLIDEETTQTEEEPLSGERGRVPLDRLLIGVAVFVVLAAIAAFRTRKL